MDTAVLLSIFAIFSVVITGLFKLISDGQKATIALSESLNAVASTNKEIAEATKKGASEAKARNGHLADITVLARDQVIDVIQNIAEQHVKKQTVDKQTVKEL